MSERSSMIRKAASMPVGSRARRKILAGLKGKTASGLGDYTTLQMMGKGGTEVKVMVNFWYGDVLGEGFPAELSGNKLLELGKTIPGHMEKITKNLQRSMDNSAEMWGLPVNAGGGKQYSTSAKLTGSNVRYSVKANVITDTRYVVVKLQRGHVGFDYDKFQGTVRTVANLFGTKFK
jgi:hypothetical protein